MSGGVSQDIQRLTVVVSAVVQEGGPEFFGALPLTPQFLEVGHAEVVMHLLRYIVRGPGRPREGRNLLTMDPRPIRWPGNRVIGTPQASSRNRCSLRGFHNRPESPDPTRGCVSDGVNSQWESAVADGRERGVEGFREGNPGRDVARDAGKRRVRHSAGQ
jgi:hypothetical protein